MQVIKTSLGALWAFRQVRCLTQMGVEVVVVLPNDTEKMALRYKEELPVTVEVADLSLPVTKPWKILGRAKTLRALVDKHKPDLIHFHFVTNALLGRIALRHVDIPRVFQVPGPLHLENFFFRTAEILLADRHDYWIGSCTKTCEIYKQHHIDPERIFLSFYGGDIEEILSRAAQADGRLRRELGVENGVRMVGMSAYFYKPKYHMLQFRGLKGHEDFIDAMAIVRQKRPDTVGVLIGGPWGRSEAYYRRMKKRAAKKAGDGILFAGFRSDIYEIYPELSVVAHPSRSENLGGAAESLLIGVPTVSTNIGGFPDIVINGETGLTVPPKRPELLAEAILTLLDEPEKAKRMADNGVKLLTEVIDVRHTARQVYHAYQDVLDHYHKQNGEKQ